MAILTYIGDSSAAVAFANTFVPGGFVYPSPTYLAQALPNGLIQLTRYAPLASTAYYNIHPQLLLSGDDLTLSSNNHVQGTIREVVLRSDNRGDVARITGLALDGADLMRPIMARLSGDNTAHRLLQDALFSEVTTLSAGPDNQSISERELVMPALETVDLGDGDDSIRFTPRSDEDTGAPLPPLTLQGGAGRDHLILTGLTGPSTLDIASGEVRQGAQVLNYFDGFETFNIRGQPPATVIGTADAEYVFAGSGGDLVLGYAGNDTLSGRWGMDTLVGGEGEDHLEGGTEADLLFGDLLQPQYARDLSDQVFRLYQATLGRAPDLLGHQDWMLRLLTGDATLSEVATGFVDSREFQNTYGDLTAEQFVRLLYQNVLGREADMTGLTDWVGRLNSGSSQADVVIGFSESQEFINCMADQTTDFAQTHSRIEWADEVYRVYRATLDRDPDRAGLEDWMGRLNAGTDLIDVIAGFVMGDEFNNTYGHLDDDAFVELLYQNVLNRASDAAGKTAWLSQLDNTFDSLFNVVLGFSESPEFIANSQAGMIDWMRGLGTDDVLQGGAGDDTLFGGDWSDRFVFQANSDGHDRILDLDLWDQLEFQGFGYDSPADVLAHMT